MKNIALRSISLLLMTLTGCATQQENPMRAVLNVDLKRFMGDWYVIASIPTFPERHAVNPLENYKLKPDGTIATTFSFNNKRADGPKKTLTMTGFASAKPNNGIWAMQWIWPIKADYRIVYLDEDYQFTIIGRNKRDYVWIMSRAPMIDESKLQELMNLAVDLGYDRAKIKITSWQKTPKEEA